MHRIEFPIQDAVSLPLKTGAIRVFHKLCLQPLPPRLATGFDFLYEMEIILLGHRIIGVACHGNIAASALLIDSGGQPALIQQPPFHVREGFYRV